MESGPKEASKTFRLIELPLSLPHRMERYGHDAIPTFRVQVIDGDRNPDFLEERFQPIGPVVFVQVDGIPGRTLRMDGGSGSRVGGGQIMAIRAGESVGQGSVKGKSAAFTGGRLNGNHGGPAVGADQAIRGTGMVGQAELASFRVEQSNQGVEGCPNGVRESGGLGHLLGWRSAATTTACTIISPKATHPSKRRPEPQIQALASGAAVVAKL